MTADTSAPLFNRWTWGAIGLTLAPLILWGAASVFLLAVTCGIDWYLAWIPSASTTGVMLLSSNFSMTETLSGHVRSYARTLAYFCISLDTLVAGLHLVLPAKVHPDWGWLLLIGMLPPLMGGIAWHMVGAALREHRADLAAVAAAQLAATDAQRERDAAAARSVELAAAAAATREIEAANARKRAAAVAAVNTALTGPTLVRTPQRSAARKATKPTLRDAAVTELVRQHRAGVDIRATVTAELDTAIGASKGYCKKFIAEVIDQVLTAERRTA